MSGAGDSADRRADALAALDARSWAQLLRSLRSIDDAPVSILGLLERPTSELSSGPARRALCTAIAQAGPVLTLLADDAALPAAVHAALDVPSSEERMPVPSVAPASPVEPAENDRARTLRRSLDDERRRREGAEARAQVAQARAEAAVEEIATLRAEVEALTAALEEARSAVEQAAARAERRAGARLTTVEQELASERSAIEVLRREHDRCRSELEVARAELADLREREADRPASSDASAGAGRPIVLPPDVDDETTEAARWLAARASLVIVDGYNAALLLRPGLMLEEQRRWLIDRVRPLAVRGPARPVIIFDGAGTSGTLRDTGGVEVRFTADGTIADDEIVFAVAATDEPVLVVTDDAELRARVQAEGGNTIGVVHLPGIVDA
jgi:hypothetical protein